MAEIVVMGMLFVGLLVYQWRQRKKIVLSAHKSKVKLLLAITLAWAILYLFWPDHSISLLKLLLMSILLLASAMMPEGLSSESLIKLGYIDASYSKYEKIEVEALRNDQTLVTFYKQSRDQNGIAVRLDACEEDVKSFLRKRNVEVMG